MNEKLNLKTEHTEENLNLIGNLSSGEKVFDKKQSHIHMNPDLEILIPEVLKKIDSTNRDFLIELVMPSVQFVAFV